MGLTVRVGRIGKDIIHEHFAGWLVDVQDDKGVTEVIPVAPANSDIAKQLVHFADEVAKLKREWDTGRSHVRRSRSGWRSQLRFPPTIERTLEASLGRFEYKHGPLQATLQDALDACLRKPCATALNQNVDLAILARGRVLGIFEVKTDLGSQIYTGVGQLFVYRHFFGSRRTPLFLVIPSDARDMLQIRAVGPALQQFGITLLLGRDGQFRSWDGRPLRASLLKAGLPVR
jgi:hypothetical protein